MGPSQQLTEYTHSPMSQTNRRRRSAAAIVAAAALAVALSGCSQLNATLHESFPDFFGPERGSNGRVVAPVEAHATWLEVGDCFSFASDDTREEVLIVPCSADHVFEVIGAGDVSTAEVAQAGSLQNAISAKCAEPFEAFKADAPEGSRPDQEFLVSERRDGDRVVTEFFCAAALTKL